jgi:cell division protein FtsW
MKPNKGQPDYILVITIALLLVFGIVMITSIGVPKSIDLTRPSGVLFPTCGVDGVDCYYLLKKHLVRVAVALVGFFFAAKIPYIFWKRIAIPFFGVMFVTMFAVLIMGQAFSTTARSWLVVANSSIQPAEIAKLALIFYLAVWMERKGRDVKDLKKGFYSFVLLSGVIIFPIILQPDLGSTMVFAFIAVAMYFVAGAQYRHILTGAIAAFLIVLMLLPFVDYIQYRFKAYINPSEENCQIEDSGSRRDFCWQTEQANIAIASGGFFGRGLTQGVQKSYWLPQASDDFIFAASAEEIGFLRSLLVVFGFGIIAHRGFMIAKYAPDRFSMYTAVGITTWIVGQAYINIGVNTGVLPITGITLPFVSYGGTSLVSTLVGAGVLVNISKYTALYYVPSTNRRGDSGSRDTKHSSYRRT